MKKKIIIYIAGYGRSGSTILNYKLSNYLSALSLGEIISVNKEYYLDINSKCSCGKKLNLCKLAKNLIAKDRKKNIEIWYKKILPQASYLIKYFLYFYIKKIKRIENIHLNDLKKIKNELDIIDKIFPNVILVDSSKSTFLSCNRPYILKKLGYEVIIIHIYKPFFSSLKSIISGSNYFLMKKVKKEKSFRILRFFIGFIFSNLSALMLAIDFQYIKIKNHDLLTRESYVIKKISKFILNIASNKKIKFKKTDERHLMSGNRLKNYTKQQL